MGALSQQRVDGTSRRARHRRARPRRARGIVAAVLGIVVALVALVPVGPALAAGSGVLNLSMTPIDIATGDTQTDAGSTIHNSRISYRVQFSCTAAACDNTQIRFSPSQPDPYGLLPADRHLLNWESWVAPTVGSPTIGGTDSTGKLVSLGNLAAGVSNTFTLTYLIQADTARAVPYGSFYPDGFPIEMSATISSDTATASVTAPAAAVTWNIDVPAGPTAAITAATSVETDEPVVYSLTMNGGNMVAGGGSNVYGRASLSAVGSYQVVYHAPAEAVIVSAEEGGVIDPVAHTVTWTSGSAADPVYGARGGWGLNQVSGFNGQGPAVDNVPGADNYALWKYRGVTLEFPGENFPAADESGCNFATSVTSSIDVSVTYLDADRTTKTTTATRTNQVACWDPFGGVSTIKRVTGGAANQSGAGDGALPGGAYAVNIPAPGEADRTLVWRVDVGNQGNVPGVAVIDEPDLTQDDLEVYQIWPQMAGATVEWVADDGTGVLTSGTTTLAANQMLDAPAGGWFVSARATTDPLAPGRIQPTDTTQTLFYLNYRFRVKDDAPLGEQRTNTAHVSMTYPGYEGDIAGLPIVSDPTRTVQFTQPSPVLTAAFTGAPVVVGGGTLTPGTEVSFTMRGATNEVWPGTQIVPQIAFIAPAGWTVVPGSAELAAGAPAGVSFSYATESVGGVLHDVVLATWPTSVTPSTTGAENWPALTVRATPTASASTGVGAAIANVRVADASGAWSAAVASAFASATNQFRASPGGVVDADDLDGDGNATEYFSQAAATALTVAASQGLQVVKELCVEDADAPDGCDWVADATQPHVVPVTADDVRYRITVTNSGNATVSGVVAYDVLPYEGDTGLLPSPSARGSQFAMTLHEVESVSPGVTMAYSASTNPARPEVNPGATGTVDDWGPDPDGKRALRLAVAGSLPPGESRQIVFTAAVETAAAADEQACNTVAVDSAQTLPVEPLAVCVTLGEADLSVELTSFDGLQAGRPGTLDFEVVNHGGSAVAPAAVDIELPVGLTASSLEPEGWSCSAPGGAAAPVDGPATLSCAPVDGVGEPRDLARDEPETLSLPVRVSADLDGDELCVTATIAGPLFDPVDENNATDGCRAVAPATAGLAVTKDDGVATTRIGDELTYLITVTNTLTAESIAGATVQDVLPASLAFVSATAGGAAIGQTVAWTLAPLAPGASVQLSVTARVIAGAVSPLVNQATASAPDPADGAATLSATGSDSDVVRSLSVTKTSDAATDPQPGDVVTYTVTVTNDGPGSYTPAEPASVVDDLTGVLDDAEYDDDAEASTGAVPTRSGNSLSWSGALASGASAEITYSVTLGTGGDGDVENVACVPEAEVSAGAERCAEETFGLALLTVGKSVEPGSGTSVSAGDEVTYTLALANSGTAAAEVAYTDLLAGVVDDATLVSGPTASDASVTAEPGAGDTIQLSGTVAVGTTVTVTYVVVVNPDGEHGDDVLENFLVPQGGSAPEECLAADPLCTTNPVSEIAAWKSVAADATPVQQGTVLTYTLTFENVGTGSGPVDVIDDLVHVSDDAAVTAEPTSAVLTASRAGDLIEVEGDLEPGEQATVTYQVTVLPDGERGDDLAANFLLRPDEDGAVEAPADPVCQPTDVDRPDCTLTPIGRLVVSKAVSASADQVVAGTTLTYTLTFDNQGMGAVAVDKTDDLAGVLDDAVLDGEAEVSDDALSVSEVAADAFRVTGVLASGQTVVVTYRAVVNAVGDRGDNAVDNFLVDEPGDAPVSCEDADPTCTHTPLAAVTDAKTVDVGSGAAVSAGQTLVYTLTFVNAGQAAGAVDRVDDLSGVTDDAAVTSEPVVSDPALAVTRMGDLIAITGDLAPGQAVTVRYAVTVEADDARGDDVLANFLLDPGAEPRGGAACDPESGADEPCTVNPAVDTPPPGLSSSGVTVLPLLIGGGLALAAGLGLVLLVRRRREA